VTPQQSKLLAYLKEYIGNNGHSPSYEEMKAHLQLKSKSGPHRILSALKHQGKVLWWPHRARAIELLGEHKVACPHCGGAL
jgi:repressor LexA